MYVLVRSTTLVASPVDIAVTLIFGNKGSGNKKIRGYKEVGGGAIAWHG